MVRVLHHEYIDDGLAYEKLAGLTDDEKPEGGLITGSEYLDIEAGKTYYYDEEADTGKKWVDPTAS